MAVPVRRAGRGHARGASAAAAAGVGGGAARPLVPSGSPGGDCLAVLEAVTAGLARLGPMAAVAAHEAAAHLTGGLWLAPAVPPLNVNTTWDTAGVIAAS